MAPSHHLNQWWLIVRLGGTLMLKMGSTKNLNSNIFNQKIFLKISFRLATLLQVLGSILWCWFDTFTMRRWTCYQLRHYWVVHLSTFLKSCLMVVSWYACSATRDTAVTVKSAWWLQVAWHQIGTRTSATIMMTYPIPCIPIVTKQNGDVHDLKVTMI